MKITKHGQSCVMVEAGNKKILVDPGVFAFGLEYENLKAVDYEDCDLIIITHEHPDHFDAEAVKQILEAGKAKLFATEAVCKIVKSELPEAKCRILADGVSERIGEINIQGCISHHGPLPTGAEPPEVIGVVIDDGARRLYSPGDTLKLDQNVGEIDIAFVPICGEVVMNIEQAKAEIEKLKPGLAIPYHYDNPRFPVDVNHFGKTMEGSSVPINILKNGQEIEI